MFYFYLDCFHIQYNFSSENYLLLLVYNNLPCLKMFLISLIILSFIASFSFFSLKRFLTLLIVLPSISFFSLKRVFTYLIMLSFVFYLFPALFSFVSLKECFLPKTCYLIFLREHFAVLFVPPF